MDRDSAQTHDVSEIDSVLDYWFGACGADGAVDPVKRRMWFGDGHKYDGDIRRRFAALHERASRGELTGEWSATPRGRIALVVVLDQFSRHIHRGTAAAFEQDPAAQALVVSGLRLDVDHHLIPAQRAFFYLPLEHAEDIELQRLGVRCFDGLAHVVAPAWRKEYEGYLDYAVRHRDIIERFRRFPHRNAILGRKSTKAEIAFLKEPGSSF